MINPILFRGGMYGDLLLGMIDPTALIDTKKFTLEYKHSRCADKYIKYTRTFMKKFFMYTEEQKEKYYCRFNTHDVWVLTHDTEYSLKHKAKTVQLVCSDLDLLPIFAKRFDQLHAQHVITEAKTMLENNLEFVDDYSKSISDWQDVHMFPKRFDIKNIYKRNKFIKDVAEYFQVDNTDHLEKTYDVHFQTHKQ
jgi:hypothetical protein